MVPIFIYEKQLRVSALLDTGASCSCISLAFLEKAGLLHRLQSKADYKIKVGNGQYVGVAGQATLEFQIGSLRARATFAVLEDAALDVILGIDFLYTYGFQLQFQKRATNITPPVLKSPSSMT